MPAAPRATDVLGRVTLVTGPEELLNERAIEAVRAAVRRHDPEAELSDAPAATLTPGSLGELAAPSLFSAIRCVVVRELESLPEESAAGLLGYCTAPAAEIALVLAHTGGNRGSGTLARLRKLPTVTEVRSTPLRGGDLLGFLSSEISRLGGRADRATCAALVDAIGPDLRSLAAAARQLTSDFPGEPLDTAKVRRYFGGRAEAKSFAVADHAFAGRSAAGLEELRWALDGGVAPVLVTSAFAGSARGLARLLSAPRGLRDGDLAGLVGVPPWKLRTLRDKARGWSEAGLAAVIGDIAAADAAVKGAASDAAYALERLVLTVASTREG